MDKSDRDRNPELTEFKDSADTGEPKVSEPPAKSGSGMPKFQVDPSVFDEMPGTHFPVMQAKKKRSSAPIWIVLVLLVLGVGGYFGYTYWQQQNDKLAQKDQQIASLTTQKAQLEADAQKAEAKPAEPAQPSDADQVKQAAVQYVCAAATTTCTDTKTNTPKIQGDFAKVGVINQAGNVGVGVYLKRVKTSAATTWVAFFSSQNGIPKATVDRYSIPTSFLDAGEVQN